MTLNTITNIMTWGKINTYSVMSVREIIPKAIRHLAKRERLIYFVRNLI